MDIRNIDILRHHLHQRFHEEFRLAFHAGHSSHYDFTAAPCDQKNGAQMYVTILMHRKGTQRRSSIADVFVTCRADNTVLVSSRKVPDGVSIQGSMAYDIIPEIKRQLA